MFYIKKAIMSFNDDSFFKAVIPNWDATVHKGAVRMWQGYLQILNNFL
jgi:hypothetical protein